MWIYNFIEFNKEWLKSNQNFLYKYRPKSLNEFENNKKNIQNIEKWISNFKNEKHKLLLIMGKCWVGKKWILKLIAKKNMYDIFELDNSEIKNNDLINNTIISIWNCVKWKKNKIILLANNIDELTLNNEKNNIYE